MSGRVRVRGRPGRSERLVSEPQWANATPAKRPYGVGRVDMRMR